MTSELYDSVLDAIRERNEWETKQETWYEMRQRGIRRRGKPYPGAPDKHYPLADTMIEKLKPMYVGQMYANEQLASFVATCEQDTSFQTAAGEWFDYQLKQNSNFETEMFTALDGMLQNGFSVVKIYWEPALKQVVFNTVDPLHVVIPRMTEGLQYADWLVHILHLSEAQYRQNPAFIKDDDFIKRIKGRGTTEADGNTSGKLDAKELREGITCGKDNQIVLWEIYRRESEGAGWMVDTIAPVAGHECEVKASFGLPYNHGQLPFFKVQFEVTEKGWYAPRGVTEVIAPHESSLNRLWNGLFQHLDFHGTPQYKRTGGVPLGNTDNFKVRLGGILPEGIEPVIAPPSPIDFDQQMQFHRAIAEDRVSVPDLSASEHLSGAKSRGDVTATQINAIVGQSGQSNDLRARVFRLQLGVGYKMAWLLLIQFKRQELDYLQNGLLKQAPPEALHENYIIQPNGSADSWNKGAQIQRRLALYNLLITNPFIAKGELTKWLMEVEDPKDIKRLYIDPNDEQEEQAEQQAQEISIMLLGWPAKVDEGDDDKAHLQTLVQFVERRLGLGQEPITPEFARLALTHGGSHIQALQQKKDPMLRQIEAQTQPVVQILSQIAQQPGTVPGNVVQMQPQGGSVTGPGLIPAGPGSPSAAAPALTNGANGASGDPEQAKTAIQVGNMLVNMVKAGIPVTHAEINKVMADAGLAPLSMNPMSVSELNGTDGMPVEGNFGGGDMGVSSPGRPMDGMITPPVPPSELPAPVNVINIASRKKITVKREKDGSLTGEVTEIPSER